MTMPEMACMNWKLLKLPRWLILMQFPSFKIIYTMMPIWSCLGHINYPTAWHFLTPVFVFERFQLASKPFLSHHYAPVWHITVYSAVQLYYHSLHLILGSPFLSVQTILCGLSGALTHPHACPQMMRSSTPLGTGSRNLAVHPIHTPAVLWSH